MSAGHVLVVCTGNVCRSPFVERLLAAHLPDVEVSSAGTAALVGQPIDRRAAERLVARGVSPEGFRARQVSADLVADADLVVVLTRAHRGDVLGLLPRALSRVHVLGDLAGLVGAVDLSTAAGLEQGRIAELARLLHQHRGSVPPRPAADVDVVDPFRRRSVVYDQMTDQLDVMLPPVVDALRRAQ